MKLSTRSRYGLKAVVDLAQVYGTGPMTLSRLAEQQGISEAYLEQLLRTLRNAGIVETVRGAAGGYALSEKPQELTVLRVLQALEGSTAVADCVSTDSKGCKNACTCAARPLFLRLQQKIDAVLTDTTIQELAEENTEQRRRIEYAKSLS